MIYALGLADRVQQRVRGQTIAPLRALAEVAVRARALVGGFVEAVVVAGLVPARSPSNLKIGKKGDPLPSFLETTRLNEVKAPRDTVIVLRDPRRLRVVGRDRRIILMTRCSPKS